MPSIQYESALMYEKQRAAIDEPKQISVIEAGTKTGKTVGCLEWFLRQGFGGKEGRNYSWIAPTFGQAGIGYRRLKLQLTPLGNQVKYNESLLRIILPNGSYLWFRSGERPDDLYGDDNWAAVIDEASRMREEAFTAVTSTLTFTKGPLRIIGNVKGKKNWFWELARQAEAGHPEMGYHKITCWDAVEAGVLSRAWIEAKRRQFAERGREGAFRQLYEAEAGSDEDNPFGLEAIQNCIVDDFSTNRAAVAGVDLAGRGASNINPAAETHDRDFTAIALLDKQGHAVLFRQFRKDPIQNHEEIARVVRKTNALIDATGQGDETVLRLQRRGDMRVEGFRFTEVSRQDLLEGLAHAIGAGAVRFPDEPGEEGAPSLVEQLESFEYDFTGRGERWVVPKGYHDDLVMALALAVKKLPWRRGKDAPMEMPKPGGSQWTDNAEDAAWTAYKNSLPPTKTSYLEEPEKKQGFPVPMVVGRNSRWGGAG